MAKKGSSKPNGKGGMMMPGMPMQGKGGKKGGKGGKGGGKGCGK